MSLRLKLLLPGEMVRVICSPEQREKYERVARANGGSVTVEKAVPDGLYLVVKKLADEAQPGT